MCTEKLNEILLPTVTKPTKKTVYIYGVIDLKK